MSICFQEKCVLPKNLAFFIVYGFLYKLMYNVNLQELLIESSTFI